MLVFLPCEFSKNVSSYLHLNIQDARPPLLLDLLYRFDARSITVAPKRRMLDEALLFNQIIELVFGYKVILDAILLNAAWVACGVGYTETESVRIFFEEALENS